MAQPVTNWEGLDPLFRDGDVYFGGQPTADALREAKKRGVGVIVNLRSEPEIESLDFDEPALVKDLGLEYVSIPITPATLSMADADRLKEVLQATGKPILIHCASSNRCGALWAVYLNRHRDVPLDDALDRGRGAGLNSEGLIDVVRSVVKP